MSVFISYSHADQDFVDRLSLRLLNENIKVWRDSTSSPQGTPLWLASKMPLKERAFCAA
jgi:hypothetical protein